MPAIRKQNKNVCNRKCKGTFGVQCIIVEFMIFTYTIRGFQRVTFVMNQCPYVPHMFIDYIAVLWSIYCSVRGTLIKGDSYV